MYTRRDRNIPPRVSGTGWAVPLSVAWSSFAVAAALAARRRRTLALSPVLSTVFRPGSPSGFAPDSRPGSPSDSPSGFAPDFWPGSPSGSSCGFVPGSPPGAADAPAPLGAAGASGSSGSARSG
ncbi:hypothetical protein GCM10018952_15490 [Streptosporangium vulgare]